MTRTTSRPATIWTPAGELPLTPTVASAEQAMFDPHAEADKPVVQHVVTEEREHVPDDSGLIASSVPRPSGYRMLCAIPKVETEFGSGLKKADITIEHEELLTTVLFVMAMGPDCYKDPVRFPSGPYCKEGDFILVRPHVGSRVNIHGKKFRIINDDCVEAVVADPRGISRG